VVAAVPEEERSKWKPLKKSQTKGGLITGRKLSFDE
jgi:hypothetical protein